MPRKRKAVATGHPSKKAKSSAPAGSARSNLAPNPQQQSQNPSAQKHQPETPDPSQRSHLLNIPEELRQQIFIPFTSPVDSLVILPSRLGQGHAVWPLRLAHTCRQLHLEINRHLTAASPVRARNIFVKVEDLNFAAFIAFLRDTLLPSPLFDPRHFASPDGGGKIYLDLHVSEAFARYPEVDKVARWFRFVGNPVVRDLAVEYRFREVASGLGARGATTMTLEELVAAWLEIKRPFPVWKRLQLKPSKPWTDRLLGRLDERAERRVARGYESFYAQMDLQEDPAALPVRFAETAHPKDAV